MTKVRYLSHTMCVWCIRMYSSLFWSYLGLYFWKDLTLSGKRNCGVLLYFGCCQEAASVYFKIMYVAMFSFKKSANLFESF